MSSIRSQNTGPEKIVFRALKKKKVYFCAHPRGIFGRPDLIFRRVKVAVFIDSDFWHGHPARLTMPKSNRAYWRKKIAGNKARDTAVNRELRRQGWKVIRIWEYDVRRNPEKVLAKILAAVAKAKSPSAPEKKK